MAIGTGEHLIHNVGSEEPIQALVPPISDGVSPRKVVSFPTGSQPAPWFIKKGAGDTYTLLADGAPAFAKDHLIFVSLEKDIPDEQIGWNITHIRGDIYTIEKPDSSVGWGLPPDRPGSQVAAYPLEPGPVGDDQKLIHETFPPTQLWTIVPVLKV